jgi:hypothetical protein
VEYRSQTTGITDSTIPGSGMLIYRIRTGTNGNAQGPPDELYAYRPNGTNSVNGTINQAFYSAQSGRTSISATTNPSPFLTNGNQGGLVITNIGNAGDTISFFIGEAFFLPPQNLQANFQNMAINLSWQPPHPGGLGTFSGYRILRNQAVISPFNINLTYIDTDITFGSTYNYEVIAIYTNPNGESDPVTTSITIQYPFFSIAPTSANWENIPPGGTSQPVSFTITNTGGSGLIIQSVTITGQDIDEFTFETLPNTPVSLNENGTYNFSVKFLPTTIGEKTANITITDNLARTIHNIPLTGTCVLLPQVQISPESFDFETILLGQTSEEVTVTITNIGGDGLIINNISLIGFPDEFNFQGLDVYGLPLNANESLNFQVIYNPTSPGYHATRVDLLTNFLVEYFIVSGYSLELLPVSDLNGSIISDTDLNLSWTTPLEHIDYLTGYKIFKNGELKATNEVGLTNYIDSDLHSGENTYEVFALYGEYGQSEPETLRIVITSEIDNVEIIKTELFDNYPNPFNPTTIIGFNLSENDFVLIDIYNAKGQKIKTLHNTFLTKGKHQVVWNGTDENGLSVSSGIYFYRLKTSHYENIKKMLLLK